MPRNYTRKATRVKEETGAGGPLQAVPGGGPSQRGSTSTRGKKKRASANELDARTIVASNPFDDDNQQQHLHHQHLHHHSPAPTMAGQVANMTNATLTHPGYNHHLASPGLQGPPPASHPYVPPLTGGPSPHQQHVHSHQQQVPQHPLSHPHQHHVHQQQHTHQPQHTHQQHPLQAMPMAGPPQPHLAGPGRPGQHQALGPPGQGPPPPHLQGPPPPPHHHMDASVLGPSPPPAPRSHPSQMYGFQGYAGVASPPPPTQMQQVQPPMHPQQAHQPQAGPPPPPPQAGQMGQQAQHQPPPPPPMMHQMDPQQQQQQQGPPYQQQQAPGQLMVHCVECRQPIFSNEARIMCRAGCDSYYHRHCSGLTELACELLLREAAAEWACNRCICSDRRIPVVRMHNQQNDCRQPVWL